MPNNYLSVLRTFKISVIWRQICWSEDFFHQTNLNGELFSSNIFPRQYGYQGCQCLDSPGTWWVASVACSNRYFLDICSFLGIVQLARIVWLPKMLILRFTRCLVSCLCFSVVCSERWCLQYHFYNRYFILNFFF